MIRGRIVGAEMRAPALGPHQSGGGNELRSGKHIGEAGIAGGVPLERDDSGERLSQGGSIADHAYIFHHCAAK